eukprot:1849103-Pyramimonas_sp.AAC.1
MNRCFINQHTGVHFGNQLTSTIPNSIRPSSVSQTTAVTCRGSSTSTCTAAACSAVGASHARAAKKQVAAGERGIIISPVVVRSFGDFGTC